jgi:hypothetical protein
MNAFDHVQLHYRLHIYNPNDEKAKENLAVSLENWCSHLEKKKPAQLNKFKFDNDKELRTLKVHLKKEKDRRIQKSVDKIFESILKYNDKKMMVTDIFNAFIKGVTHFYNGPREMSQGDFEKTRRCNITNTKEELEQNKKLIYKCHLERLIYDCIFNHYNLFFESSQNHINKTAENFKTCFRNLALAVRVGFKSKHALGFNMTEYPCCLEIQHHSARYKQHVSTELYVRELNKNAVTYDDLFDDIVICRKESQGGYTYRIQEYKKHHRGWMRDKNAAQDLFNGALMDLKEAGGSAYGAY